LDWGYIVGLDRGYIVGLDRGYIVGLDRGYIVGLDRGYIVGWTGDTYEVAVPGLLQPVRLLLLVALAHNVSQEHTEVDEDALKWRW
jgi:hypothetical protein